MADHPVAGRSGFVVIAFFCFCGFTTSAFSQTFIFSDDPLMAGETLVKAIHITELRDDINGLRQRQGLLPVTFTDAVGPGLGPIRAIHIAELQTALNDVFDSLGRSRPVYTDAPQPTAGVTLIQLAHVAELRNAVRAAGLLILTASQTGTGSGTVTSNPVGINCGSDCTEPYLPGTTVTLTATPAAGSVFAGWNGSCTGTESCQVTMTTADRSVTATFTTVPPPLSCTLDAPTVSALATYMRRSPTAVPIPESCVGSMGSFGTGACVRASSTSVSASSASSGFEVAVLYPCEYDIKQKFDITTLPPLTVNYKVVGISGSCQLTAGGNYAQGEDHTSEIVTSEAGPLHRLRPSSTLRQSTGPTFSGCEVAASNLGSLYLDLLDAIRSAIQSELVSTQPICWAPGTMDFGVCPNP